jgi:endonuclease/exonuclease/phosphatase family metal-dependent hydrolase
MTGFLQRVVKLPCLPARRRPWAWTWLLAAALAAQAPASTAQTLSVLSFNVEHLMSGPNFARWQSFCQPLGWTESRTVRRPEALTYCDALDGTDGRGRRLSAPVHDRAAWQEKVAALARLIRQADPDVVLLQEVSDADAARLVMGPQYTVATTTELWRGHSIAQNLAIGWRTSLPASSPRIEVVEPISKAGADGRLTRPGLALTMDLGGGRQLTVLNLHLKAGCRQGRLNEATSRSPPRAFRRQADCAVLQQQVAALELWTDDKLRQGAALLIAGDFNRDLVREIRDRLPARSDGSGPSTPADPSRIVGLVAELSDEEPPAAWFSLVRAARYPQLADCHRNIDSFLLSRNLDPWLSVAPRQLSVTVIPFAEPVSLGKVRPSDHCPHLLRLPLRSN